jgi:hypothetical protein
MNSCRFTWPTRISRRISAPAPHEKGFEPKNIEPLKERLSLNFNILQSAFVILRFAFIIEAVIHAPVARPGRMKIM